MRCKLSAVVATTAISVACLGCDGPLTATVGRVSGSGSHMDAAAASDGALPGQVDPPDASLEPFEAGQNAESDGECVPLPSGLELSLNSETTLGNIRSLRASASCKSVPNFYARIDGALLVRAGRVYSLRWSPTIVAFAYRLLGGATTCPENELLNTQPDAGGDPFSDPGCREFTATVDAMYIGFGGGNLAQTSLCSSRCDAAGAERTADRP